MSSEEIEKAQAGKIEKLQEARKKEKEDEEEGIKKSIKTSFEVYLGKPDIKSTQRQRNDVVELVFHIKNDNILSLDTINKNFADELSRIENQKVNGLKGLVSINGKIAALLGKGIPKEFFTAAENGQIENYEEVLENYLLETGAETHISDNKASIQLVKEKRNAKTKEEIEAEYNLEKGGIEKKKEEETVRYNSCRDRMKGLEKFSGFIDKYFLQNNS